MSGRLHITEAFENVAGFQRRHRQPGGSRRLHPLSSVPAVQQDPKKFRTFTLDDGNIVRGHNWNLIFPIKQLHEGVIR